MNISRLVLTLWLVLCVCAGAQTPAPSTPAPVPAPAAAAATPEPVKTITKERTIYVPFDELEQVFENQGQGVFLPYREFLDMWNKLNVSEKLKKTAEPPVDGVLAGANYVGKVTGDVAEIAAKLSFESLKEGWAKLPLGAGDLSIADAKSAALLNFADGGYEILFPKKGSYELQATIYGRIARDTGRSSLHLKLPRTSVSQFEMTIPEKGLEFTITPASAFSAMENADGSTRLAVYFGASQDVNISWTKKIGETALSALLFADVQSNVHLSAGAIHTDATLNYRILRAGVNSLEVLVPENQQVLAVNGQNVKEWSLKPDKNAQRLHVDLHTPAKESYQLSIKMESPLGDLPQQVKLPLIQAQGVERQSGSVVVSSDAELVAQISALENLTQQSAAKDAKSTAQLVGSYRYLRLPYSANLAITEAKPQVEVTSETLLQITPESQDLTAQFNYTVKKAGIFSTQIELPAGFARAEATGDQVESSSVQKDGAKNVLNVKFAARRIGTFSFTVTSELPRSKPDEPAEAPVFVPQNVDRHEAKVGLAIHVSLKANTANKGDLREEDIRNLGALPIKDPAATPLTLGFRYRGTAKPAQVQFELRKPRVSTQVLALIEAREALVRHSWDINYTVEYAGVNEFAIQVPKAIADDLQIEGENIKERTKADGKDEKGAPNDFAVWTVTLQDKVLGSYTLHISHDMARGDQKQGAATQVSLVEIKPLNVFREIGEIAVIKDGNLEFTGTDAKGLELIDPKELSGSLQRDGIVLAYKYSAHPISLQLSVSKNFYLEVPTAVVTYAVLTSSIAEDQAETTEAIYWVKNNSQQFFSIKLPSREGKPAKLLSDAFVNGEPQQPSKRPDKNELLIRLPAKQDGDQAFAVRFVYEVPSPNPGSRLGWRGTLNIEAPKVADTEVMKTRWTLYLPNDFRYVKFGGAMRESIGGRGWEDFVGGLQLFVPHMGPQLPENDEAAESDPPELPPVKTAGFDTQIQKEGQSVTLHRLDAPSDIAVAFRGKTYAATVEAIACLLAFFGGVSLLGRSRQSKFAYAMFVGAGALIIAGAVNPRATGLWHAIYLGVLLSVGVWLACGLWKWLRSVPSHVRTFFQRWSSKKKTRPGVKTPPPTSPPSVPPTTPPPSAGGPATGGEATA